MDRFSAPAISAWRRAVWVPELPAPLESMARDEGAWLFYLPCDQWVPCGLMYCEGSYSGWRRTQFLADDWYFFWDAS